MSQVSIRVDDEIREQSDRILGQLGLNISSAVNIFLRLIVRSNGIPFPLTVSEQRMADRQEVFRKMFELADSNPVKRPEGYKFNRDECYDE